MWLNTVWILFGGLFLLVQQNERAAAAQASALAELVQFQQHLIRMQRDLAEQVHLGILHWLIFDCQNHTFLPMVLVAQTRTQADERAAHERAAAEAADRLKQLQLAHEQQHAFVLQLLQQQREEAEATTIPPRLEQKLQMSSMNPSAVAPFAGVSGAALSRIVALTAPEPASTTAADAHPQSRMNLSQLFSPVREPSESTIDLSNTAQRLQASRAQTAQLRALLAQHTLHNA